LIPAWILVWIKPDRTGLDWSERAAAALLFLYPVLLLTVRGGVNVCFAGLLVLAIWCLASGRASVRDLSGGEIAYAAAMASLAVATALSQLWHWNFRSSPYDDVGRFLAAVPVYLMLRSCRPQTLAGIWSGVALGAIAAALVALPQLPLVAGARASTSWMDAIRFGDLALALGILSLLSVNAGKDPPWLVALKAAGAAAGLFASIESGTRGGWIALPPVALTWWLLAGKGWLSSRAGAAAAVLLLAAAAAGFLFVGQIHDRMAALYANVAGLFHADLDTPLGLRLQIWRVALRLFAANPLFGLGPDEFQNAVDRMQDLGLLTPAGAQNGHAEVHSQILLHMVSLGLFGLAAIAAVYAVPLVLFIRAATVPAGAASFARSAGVTGACFVASFVVFGLTIEIFNLKLIATFYGLTIAVLLAAARPAVCGETRAADPGKQEGPPLRTALPLSGPRSS
jgi:O-antigen ligase